MQTLKILSRKQVNRSQFGENGTAAILFHVSNSASSSIAAEAANVILNICYEKDNVATVVRLQGVPALVALLDQSHPDVQANAAGALQSICFQVPCLFARQRLDV